jgi:ketosteroid isomerase-like protein
MSQENFEIVRSIYEAFNRRDSDAAFATCVRYFELTTPPGINAGTYRGREESQGYLEDLISAFEEWTSQPEELIESGDQVAVVVRTRARPNISSTEIEIRTGHLWTIRDGMVVSMRMFPKPDQALEAAGLRE